MKKIVFTVVLLLCTVIIYALLIDYTFTQTFGTYSEITDGISLGDATTDDQRFVDPAVPLGGFTSTGPGFPIGFNFTFNDTQFDVIGVCANGWISFGQSALGAVAVDMNVTSYITPLSTTVVVTPSQLANRVTGWGRDIQSQAGASILIETSGTAPNRITTIQWKNYKRYGTGGTGDIINYQIKLYETTNKVALVYGPHTHGATDDTSEPQVGMRGPETTDFINRTTTTDWAATTAGATNAATCTWSATCMPVSGLIFEFNPPPTVANDLQALSFTGPTGPAVGAAADYTLTVRNRGSVAQSTYTVQLMSGTTVLASVAGPAINSEQVIPVVVSHTFTAQGPITVFGRILFAADQNLLNNDSAPIDVVVQPTGSVLVEIGNGTLTQRQPFGIFYDYERDAALYTSAEIGAFGALTALKWYCGTANPYVVPYKIYLKSTTETTLAATPWATMIADATLMQDATYAFAQTGWVTFNFATPFIYNSDNLLVLIETNVGDWQSAYPYFRYHTGPTGAHQYWYQDGSPPTANGTLNLNRPDIRIFLETAGLGHLSGTVTAGGNPLEGAKIEIQTTTLTKITNSAGTYSFPYMLPGTYSIRCSKTGYYTQLQNVTIAEDQIATVDFNLTGYAMDEFLTSPNGSEVWLSGTTQMILWQAVQEDVELSLTFDNGSNWLPIVTMNGNNGYYYYNVPSISSSFCRIKITLQSNPAYFDLSDNMFSISTSSTQPKVVLTYPSNIGLHFGVNQNINITWTRQNVSNVALDFSMDDGQTWIEIINDLNADSYNWMVPDTPSAECRIRVRSNINNEVSDVSDNRFSISKIRLLSPNGGEVLTGDYSNSFVHQITWSSAGMTNVKIEYSANSGNSWILIHSSYPAASGNYVWYLPGIPSDNYIVRVSNAANIVINDTSDEAFSIRNPLKLINANGGGFITNNSLFNIRWKNQDISPDLSIWWEHSTNNSSWTRINTTAVPVTDESMWWYVNTGTTGTMWLRAVENTTSRIVGKSESSFRVTDKILMLFEPNGGESYLAESNQTISWDYSGLTNLNVDLTTDDGLTWTSLDSNVPVTNLTYNWIVPDIPSPNCRIRLSDVNYSYMNLESDANFAILPLVVIPPTVDFIADVTEGEIPLTVHFTEDINPGTGTIASRLWDFGDGNTSGQSNPTHVYTIPGTYSVSLTVTNYYDSTTTFTRTNYITATPNYPRAELTSSPTLNFGVVYLGDVSPAMYATIKNTGTAPLTISNATFYQVIPRFIIQGVSFPQVLAIGDSLQIPIVFTPAANATVSDSVRFINDSINQPVVRVKLMGIGQYVPPKPPENVVVVINGDDAVITWNAVTETIFDTPIVPDGYIILYNETAYEDEQFYYYLDYTTTALTYAHNGVTLFRNQMFYKVIAFKDYDRALLSRLDELNRTGQKIRYKDLFID